MDSMYVSTTDVMWTLDELPGLSQDSGAVSCKIIFLCNIVALNNMILQYAFLLKVSRTAVIWWVDTPCTHASYRNHIRTISASCVGNPLPLPLQTVVDHHEDFMKVSSTTACWWQADTPSTRRRQCWMIWALLWTGGCCPSVKTLYTL